MVVKVEWLTGIIRVCETAEDGSPYNFAVTVVREGNGTTAHLKGAAGTFSRETFRAVVEKLRAEGITTIVWERKNNKPRKVRHEIG